MGEGPRIGSICSGMGGLCELGIAPYVGGRVVWHADYEPPSQKNPRPKQSASKVLAHHWPATPNLGDLSTVDWSKVEKVEWLTGGYPCGPFSVAGIRKGTEDERHIWPHVVTAISHLRPPRLFFENVAGHVSLGLDVVLGDLATMGYDAAWGVVPASAAGAPHRRERVFILGWDRDAAHTQGDGREQGRPESARFIRRPDAPLSSGSVAAHTDLMGPQRGQPTGGRDMPAGGVASHADSMAGAPTAALRRGSDQRVGSPTEQRIVRPDGDAVPDPEGSRRLGGGIPDDTLPQHGQPGDQGDPRPVLDWGPYRGAVQRWERTLGRPAPPPLEVTKTGSQALSPALTEWVMGLPQGHVTDVPGMTRAERLHVLGNGCVPAQVQLALSLLLPLLDDH